MSNTTDVKRQTKNIKSRESIADMGALLAFERSAEYGILRFKNTVYAVFLIILFIPALSFAQNVPEQPVGHVNDFADMLSETEEQRLETKLRNYRDTTTTVIAVATIKSLEGRDIQPVGTELFNQWNIWQGDQNNGVLILIAEQERRMRIEVGYGLEGAIPDVMAGRIIRNVLNPAFKKGDFLRWTRPRYHYCNRSGPG